MRGTREPWRNQEIINEAIEIMRITLEMVRDPGVVMPDQYRVAIARCCARIRASAAGPKGAR